jgi:peptidoglycan/LPS O-acetylase OafA/YrhL
MTEPSLSGNLSAINGLRAISVLLVIFHHLEIKYHFFDVFYGHPLLEYFTYFLHDGHLGVNIFFVVSGFLITLLLLQEENQFGKISIKNFYARRALRILPAFVVLLVVYFILQQFNIIQLSPSSWATSLTYTKYLNWWQDWETAHFWSLGIEEFFYLFWPLVFVSGKRLRKIVLILIILIVPIFRIIYGESHMTWMDDFSPFQRMDAISLGCLMAFYQKQIILLLEKYWTFLFMLSIVVILVLPQLIHEIAAAGYCKIFFALGTTHGSIGNIAIAIIVLYSVHGPKNLWQKILGFKPMQYLGIISYGIYLWQQIFISGRGHGPWGYPQNLIFLLLAAVVSYHFIEKPFLRLKKRFRIVGKKNQGMNQFQEYDTLRQFLLRKKLFDRI